MQFAANLSTLFGHLPFMERFGLARQYGFEVVEFWFPYDMPRDELRSELQKNSLRVGLINTSPGRPEAGEWGVLALPNRKEFFWQSFQQALQWAEDLGCSQVHVLVGKRDSSYSESEQWNCIRDNLSRAVPLAETRGITLLIEAINTYDIPGFFLNRSEPGLALVREFSSPYLKFLYDVYHMQRMEGNLTETLLGNLPEIGHIQIADVPGRHAPGSGEINFTYLLQKLQEARYSGLVGLEYFPQNPEAEDFSWLTDLKQQLQRLI